MNTIKITRTVETRYNTKVTSFYANGILVMEHKSSKDYYCKIEGGRPSNIRSQVKAARSISWKREGIEQVTGKAPSIGSPRNYTDKNFINDYNDTTWGYTGPTCPSIKTVSELINAFAS